MAKKSDSSSIAFRYALALIEMAQEEKALKSVEADMAKLEELLAGSREMLVLVRNPLLSQKQQLQSMALLAEEAKFHKLTAGFLGVLAQNRRLSYLGVVLVAFRREMSRRRGEVIANVECAYALTPAQAKALKTELGRALGRTVGLDVKVDRSLIGGLRVTVGSRMIDNTIRRKLERLRRTLRGQAGNTMNEVA